MFPRMCLKVLRVGRPVIAMLTLEQFPEMVYEVCDAVSAIVALGALETLGRDLLHLHQGNEWKRQKHYILDAYHTTDRQYGINTDSTGVQITYPTNLNIV